jgi:hypothetical protein
LRGRQVRTCAKEAGDVSSTNVCSHPWRTDR